VAATVRNLSVLGYGTSGQTGNPQQQPTAVKTQHVIQSQITIMTTVLKHN